MLNLICLALAVVSYTLTVREQWVPAYMLAFIGLGIQLYRYSKQKKTPARQGAGARAHIKSAKEGSGEHAIHHQSNGTLRELPTVPARHSRLHAVSEHAAHMAGNGTHVAGRVAAGRPRNLREPGRKGIQHGAMPTVGAEVAAWKR